MSYDIDITDPKTGEIILFDQAHDLHGGTYQVGGTHKAWINITYNYAPFYYKHIDRLKGIRALYGKTGFEVAQLLVPAIAKLGTERSSDYWEATPGNAGAALADLMQLCLKAPDGIVVGD